MAACGGMVERVRDDEQGLLLWDSYGGWRAPELAWRDFIAAAELARGDLVPSKGARGLGRGWQGNID